MHCRSDHMEGKDAKQAPSPPPSPLVDTFVIAIGTCTGAIECRARLRSAGVLCRLKASERQARPAARRCLRQHSQLTLCPRTVFKDDAAAMEGQEQAGHRRTETFLERPSMTTQTSDLGNVVPPMRSILGARPLNLLKTGTSSRLMLLGILSCSSACLTHIACSTALACIRANAST